jgi:hypothetical protein
LIEIVPGPMMNVIEYYLSISRPQSARWSYHRTQTLGRAHTQNIYIERWDGGRAWQTVYQRTYMFAENSEWMDADTYDVRHRPTANQEGQRTRMFDESPYENENVLRVCPSTAYREITGSRDTRYVGCLRPVGEG